jgi:hypothetical protein
MKPFDAFMKQLNIDLTPDPKMVSDLEKDIENAILIPLDDEEQDDEN